jgi:hypothetical protein
MAMGQKPSRYLSYLLRLWQTSNENEEVWYASLECPGSRKRYTFTDLRQLVAFLEEQTGEILSCQEENDDEL